MLSCTSTICTVILSTIIPIIGNITAVLVILAPIPAIIQIRRLQSLGNTNPIPFSCIYVNSQVWLWYGVLIKDVFVAAPNIIGAIAGGWYIHSTYNLSTSKQKRTIDMIVLIGPMVVYLVGMIAHIYLTAQQGRNALGILAIVYLCMFYSSPLSVLINVIQTKNASAFNQPLAWTCLMNGVCWVTYGFHQKDVFQIGPNGLGAVMALVQLWYIYKFPAKYSPPIALSEEDVAELTGASANGFDGNNSGHTYQHVF